MEKTKDIEWFSGGIERGKAALELIADLVKNLHATSEESLRELLADFYKEINAQGQSIPFIMSRMNIAVSRCMKENGIVLSNDNSNLMNHLLSMNYIRYGC